MISRAKKLRFRRNPRLRQRQVGTVNASADKHFFRRLERLGGVRRFLAAWIALFVLLIGCSIAQLNALSGHYQVLKPAGGGIYNEGVLGSFTNANPVYVTSAADRTVSKLLFASLFTYDDRNQLVGDLASGYTADERGQVYTVKLKDNIRWHDGQPVTVDDILFTYKVIQSPDAKSSLNASWQGVTVKAIDDRTFSFSLANPLTSFPYSMTNGILPKHILQDVPMENMRSNAFNTSRPVGAGPFRWQDLSVSGSGDDRQERISLTAFDKYHRGAARLDNFTVHTFQTPELLTEGFARRELQAVAGLPAEPANEQDGTRSYSFPQSAAVMTFFKTTSGVLADKSVRQALVQAADTTAIRRQLPFTAQAVDAPLLKDQVGYDKTVTQLPFDQKAAAEKLEAAGWKRSGSNPIRQKDGQKLSFSLYAENNSDTARSAKVLQQQWRAVGADVKVELQTASDFQVTLSQHSYDALLRGIEIGVDPDVFVYWHSSQANVLAGSRLNFSEYKSPVTDDALEQARTRTDQTLRTAKFKPFLTAWRDDAPAFGLYQPRFLYLTRQPVYGLQTHQVNSANDRLNNVDDWMIRRVKTTVD